MINGIIKSTSIFWQKRALLKITLLLISMLTIMAAGIVAPATPQIGMAFADSFNPALLSKMVLALPPLSIAITAPLAGRLLDQNGRLNLLNFALVLYAVSGSSGLYLDNIYLILGGRIILGIAIGILMTTVLTLTGDYFEGHERQQFIGYQSAFIGFVGMVVVTIGGFLAELHWRWPFATYLISLLLLLLTKRYLYQPNIAGHQAASASSSTPSIIHLLWFTAILLMILMYLIPIQLPFLIQELGLGTQIFIGLVLATHAFGIVLSSIVYSKVKQMISYPMVYFFAFIVMALGHYIIGTFPTRGGLFTGVFIAGLGFGQLISNTTLWVIDTVQTHARGRVIGILTSCYFLGQFLSPILAEPFLSQGGAVPLFLSSAILMAVVGILFLGYRQKLSRPVA